MYYLDLFSGIGGFALGAYWAGWRFQEHYFSEVDEYAIKIYRQRFPDVIGLGDIKEHGRWELPGGEYVITAGFPCQPFSLSGKRKQRADDRYLWPILLEFIQQRQPCLCILENVIALDSGEPVSVLEEIYNDLEKAGYTTFPVLDIPAACFNPIQERRRFWVIAYTDAFRRSERRRFQNTQDFQNEFERLDDEDFRKAISVGEYGRGHNGIPAELDRLKCLGNAIVPQIAELLFRQLKISMGGER